MRVSRLVALALAAAAACSVAGGQAAQPVDSAAFTLALQPVARGFKQPTDIVASPDGSGRLFVVERAGTIRVVAGGDVLPMPFLDLSPLVGTGFVEQGLLGLAFHPQYAQNGQFYVNYTNQHGDTTIARYNVSADPNIADPGTGSVVLGVDQPAVNHNGGHLVFGPDGYLWIGLGDGGGAGDQFHNAQDGHSLLGKLLRLDVDSAEPYAVPHDNPFVGSSEVQPEVWALGLRNPWRYSFDRATNDLFIADVGQNAFEEIDLLRSTEPGGQNYGWPIMEGLHCFPASQPCDRSGLELPIAEYGHNLGCSATGGFVYRGQAFPQLVGLYLFGDFCSGRVWSLREGPDGTFTMAELLHSNLQISSFGEDEAGELYLAGFNDGAIYQVTAR
ncbi:MAG: PQQ-dependent sugar dehydrogenase [Chloroflexi bacterium]|nr:PQQ-dependent sugar dehydrogenase [Chloroflexota bacterium]